MAKKTRRQKQRSMARRPELAPAQARTLPAAAPQPPAGAPPAPVLTPAPPPGPAAPDAEDAEADPRMGMRALEEVPGRRRVGRIVPGAAAATAPAGPAGRAQRQAQRTRYGSAAAMVAPLESEDPAIPWDRVPYVPADLRRVAVIALIMIVLILVAWFVVAHTVSS
jgi:hypothetical protein